VRQTSTSESIVNVGSVAGAAVTRDDALVDRARRGDRDAFALLIEPRAAQLLRMARAILGNETDAYEAAQEALIAAWLRLPGLRDADRFDAWLNRTLVNKCRDALRKRGRVREIDFDASDLTTPDTTQERVAEAAVEAAFDRLSLDERHILVLHHLQGLPLAQVACQLRIPLGTAKSRLWSARRHLERALEAER
jgi:RNA polymerase sigma-70 factor, ECF subfamily